MTRLCPVDDLTQSRSESIFFLGGVGGISRIFIKMLCLLKNSIRRNETFQEYLTKWYAYQKKTTDKTEKRLNQSPEGRCLVIRQNAFHQDGSNRVSAVVSAGC